MTRWKSLAVVVLLLVACSSPSASPTAAESGDSEQTVDASADSSAPLDARGTPVKCGVERWDVKTGTDAAARQVNLTPMAATIRDLTAKPSQLPAGARNAPRSSDERQTYTVHATLTGYKLEGDSDFHLVIASGADHMIVEIPNPGCVKSTSPFKAAIRSARAAFLALVGAKVPSSAFTTTSLPVTVTGVLFYDFLHGQTGLASNGAELHPLLAVSSP